MVFSFFLFEGEGGGTGRWHGLVALGLGDKKGAGLSARPLWLLNDGDSADNRGLSLQHLRFAEGLLSAELSVQHRRTFPKGNRHLDANIRRRPDRPAEVEFEFTCLHKKSGPGLHRARWMLVSVLRFEILQRTSPFVLAFVEPIEPFGVLKLLAESAGIHHGLDHGQCFV